METGLIGENKFREVRPGDFELCALDATGDTKTIWSKDNDDEIDNARKTFNDLTKKGHKAYCVKKDGSQGKVMSKFDPKAERMVLVPPVGGG